MLITIKTWRNFVLTRIHPNKMKPASHFVYMAASIENGRFDLNRFNKSLSSHSVSQLVYLYTLC